MELETHGVVLAPIARGVPEAELVLYDMVQFFLLALRHILTEYAALGIRTATSVSTPLARSTLHPLQRISTATRRQPARGKGRQSGLTWKLLVPDPLRPREPTIPPAPSFFV